MDSIDNLKKLCIQVNKQFTDEELKKDTIEKTIESFLWANGIFCSISLDCIDDSFPN